MKRIVWGLFAIVAFFTTAQAQPTNSIRGTIRDAESKSPLIGASVLLPEENKGAVTDELGRFIIKGVPVGRKQIKITYVGYQSKTLSNIPLNSGKELVLDVELELSVSQTIVIEGNRGAVLNEMATVSARTFDITETDKYAGSRGDPARMASNFAGVQGADDSRNDIVVRGNSPSSVLWRMEGVDLPNPNHFAIAGTGGGPVSIINNKYLSNSDFYTGAFPAILETPFPGCSICGCATGTILNLKERPNSGSWEQSSCWKGRSPRRERPRIHPSSWVTGIPLYPSFQNLELISVRMRFRPIRTDFSAPTPS